MSVCTVVPFFRSANIVTLSGIPFAAMRFLNWLASGGKHWQWYNSTIKLQLLLFTKLSNIFFFHYFRPVHQLVSRSFSFRHDSAFLHCIIIPRWVQKNLERFFTPKILRIVVCATLQKKSSKFQSIFVQFCKSVIFSMGPQTHRDSKLESTSSFRGGWLQTRDSSLAHIRDRQSYQTGSSSNSPSLFIVFLRRRWLKACFSR